MHEIKCPHCQKTFTLDEAGYADILKQVHDAEFKAEIAEQIKQMETQKKQEIEILTIRSEQAKKDALAQLQKQIDEANAKIKAFDSEKKLALAAKDNEIRDEIVAKDREIDLLSNNVKLLKEQSEKDKLALQNQYTTLLQAKEEEIKQYKDFKSKLSTKMIGESLEQYCSDEFNKLRSAAFQGCYFEKDNEVVKDAGDDKGSKGDFVFREEIDGVENLSIMFEMKNESDDTEKKHKNEDFFKKLDKDRNNKKCEYAVLVSTLEPDSELYNGGIVDVSHRYPKMYVVRPQFFIPMITLLRNAAQKSLEFKKQVAIYEQNNLDVKLFEQEVDEFKSGFATTYSNAQKKFEEAIKGIDTTIEKLQKVKEALTTSSKHFDTANKKVGDLSIKKLVANHPTVAKMFEDAKKEDSDKE